MNYMEVEKEDLKNNVKQYISIEDEISKLRIAIRERNKKLKLLSSMIINEMETNNITDININNGKLVYKNTTTYKSINKKSLMDGLILYFNKDEVKAVDAHTIIYNNREKQNKVFLKLKKF